MDEQIIKLLFKKQIAFTFKSCIIQRKIENKNLYVFIFKTYEE